MSASPSGLSNGQTPTPNGGPPQFIRKAKPADPLRPRKKSVRRPNLPPGSSGPKQNGLMPASGRSSGPPHPNGVGPARGMTPANGVSAQPVTGGWTNPPPTGTYRDYPLVTTKRALREDLRYHIARFSASKAIDPGDQNQFTRPVVLHRRDPRGAAGGKVDEEGGLMEDQTEDSKEREKAEIARAEKDAQRAADIAQIAPTATNAAGAAKRGQGKKPPKTEQYHKLDTSEQDKKKSDLRYEEALSWFLEDADGKNSWFGTYESALSHVNVALLVDGGAFKMVPVDKWYKFTQKAPFKTLTIEEAESRLSKGAKETRWSMQTQKKAKDDREFEESRRLMIGGGKALYMIKGETETSKSASKREIEDGDELDFEADDLFQDDDEQATVEPDQDEEVKEAQARIKREQLAANIFDQAIEAEVDKELEAEKKEEAERKRLGKEVTKALKKREKNYIYESDKSENEYEKASSDDDTSDEEKQAEIDKRKDEEAKVKAKLEAKLPSGASTKGTNTPSGRPKHSDPLKKHKSLKRPGSPNLSESSGNESTRKKHKKKHASSQPTGTSTPLPGSRPMSPAPSSQPEPIRRKSSVIKLTIASSKLSEISSAPPNPSPMSEGEATGGEISDVGKKKKHKIRIGGTPAGSRAGSPAPGRAGSVGAGGSRAASPAAQSPPVGASGARSPRPGAGPIQPHEIAAALPKEGITIGALMKLFQGRVGNIADQQTEKSEFIKMVKENSAYSPDKMLRPKKA